MKLLYLNEHLSCLNYQMNSDVGFTCQQLEKDEVYRIDNSKSSCTLFIIEGDVIFDLGKYKGLRILQNQMVFIPQKHRNSDEVYNRFEMYAFILGQEHECM